jgi:hypothetical protein
MDVDRDIPHGQRHRVDEAANLVLDLRCPERLRLVESTPLEQRDLPDLTYAVLCRAAALWPATRSRCCPQRHGGHSRRTAPTRSGASMIDTSGG